MSSSLYSLALEDLTVQGSLGRKDILGRTAASMFRPIPEYNVLLNLQVIFDESHLIVLNVQINVLHTDPIMQRKWFSRAGHPSRLFNTITLTDCM